MKYIVTIMFAGLFLAGCAPQLVSADKGTVVVKARRADASAAEAIASRECAKYGETAHLNKKVGRQFFFDCMP